MRIARLSAIPKHWSSACAMACLAIALSGCRAPEVPLPEPPKLEEANFPGLGDCRELFAEADAMIDAANVRHAAYRRVPGFPYLRTDRVLATFSHEVDGINDVGTWVRRMRELDYEARYYELANLGLPRQDRANLHTDLFRCGRGLAFVDFEDESALDYVRDVVATRDNGWDERRNYGIYRAALPLLKVYVSRRHADIRASFSRPLPQERELSFWQAEETRQRALSPASFDDVLEDPLGFPGMIASSWQAVAEQHAPQLWIESAAAGTDGPGVPQWAGDHVVLDHTDPTVYYQVGFTRAEGKHLVQITYVLFLAAGTANGKAAFNGLVWRVTLDRNNQPLLYDSVPATGWPHLVFPVQPLAVKSHQGDDEESVLIPQEDAPGTGAVLRIGKASPQLQRVVNREQANPQRVRSYRLKDYEALFLLPHPDGGTRSLFSPDGVVAGSANGERFWFRLAGYADAGAVRQLGRLPNRLVGNSYFDDPYMLQRFFEWPERTTKR